MRWIAVLCLVAACGGDDAVTGPVARFSLGTSGVPAPLAVPYPSDVYKDADGTLSDGLTDWTLAGIDQPEPGALLGQIGALDGFGVQAGVLFGVEGIPLGEGVDPASLDADRAVLVDVASAARVPCALGWDGFAQTIAVVPDDVLVPGHTYAAGLLAGATVTSGGTVGASAEFAKLRDDAKATGIYADAIAALAAAGVDRKQLVAATLFTTGTSHMPALDTAERLYAGAYGAPPALNMGTVAAPFEVTLFGRIPHAGWTATLDDWLGPARKDTDNTDLTGFPGGPEAATTGVPHDALAAVISGTIVSPWFPRTFAGSADYADGTTATDGAGYAVPAEPDAQIPVTIALPIGPAPQGGFPVAIFQHGLGGQRRDALAIANELAKSGIATVAIDGPLHGMRDPTATDMASNGPGTFTGADGFADGSNPLIILDAFGKLRSVLRARDVLWQFSFDLIQLRRMIDVVDLQAAAIEFGGTAPVLDKTHVALVGWSLGGLASVQFAAMSTNLDPVVLVSPASNVAAQFADAPGFGSMSTLLAAAAKIRTQAVEAGRFSAFIQAFESVLGPGDAGAFAPLVAAHHHVWLLTALEDETVPHAGTDQLARALGVTQLAPNARAADRVPQGHSPLAPGASGRVAGWLEVAPGNHSHTFDRYAEMYFEPPYPRDEEPRFVSLPAPITVRQTAVAEQRAISAFIQAVWGGTPRIVADAPALVPVADFDDDGFCDDEEKAAGTDPLSPVSKPAGAGHCVRDLGF